MKNAQTRWREPRRVEPDAARLLHLVPGTTPPRPKWPLLYVTLGLVGVAGAAADFFARAVVLRQIVDAAVGFAVVVTLAGWVHLNRVALTHAGEPEAEPGRPRARTRTGLSSSAREGDS